MIELIRIISIAVIIFICLVLTIVEHIVSYKDYDLNKEVYNHGTTRVKTSKKHTRNSKL